MFKFNLATLKSKLFWTGLGNAALGAALIYKGQTDTGLLLLGGGLTAMTGSDRLTKVLMSLEGK